MINIFILSYLRCAADIDGAACWTKTGAHAASIETALKMKLQGKTEKKKLLLFELNLNFVFARALTLQLIQKQ